MTDNLKSNTSTKSPETWHERKKRKNNETLRDCTEKLKKIKDEIEDLQQKRADAEKSYNDFQAKLATVESEIDKIVDRAVAQAEIEKVKIIEKAEQAAHDIKRSAEMAIQNELTEARRTLKNEVADQAAMMAEKLIVNNLTADDQVKIIDNYLAKVGAVQ